MTQSNTTNLTSNEQMITELKGQMNALFKSDGVDNINRLKSAFDRQLIRNQFIPQSTHLAQKQTNNNRFWSLSDTASSKLSLPEKIPYKNDDLIRLKRALNAPITDITQNEHIQTAKHRNVKTKLKTTENSNLYGYDKYLDKQNKIIQQKLQEELQITANLLKEISALTKAKQNSVYKKINKHITMTNTSLTNAFNKIDKKYFKQGRMSKQDMQKFINQTLEKYNEKTITSKHHNIREDIANLQKLNKTITAIKNNWII